MLGLHLGAGKRLHDCKTENKETPVAKGCIHDKFYLTFCKWILLYIKS